MKKFQYNFNYNADEYNWIIDNVAFNKYQQEREIFDLLILGYTSEQISAQTNVCVRTINRRRKNIHDKIEKTMEISNLLNNKSESAETLLPLRQRKDYQVYALVFPNHKIYIGQSKNPSERWGNGNGYVNNKTMYDDILLYGWDNILKIIINTNLSYKESITREKELILLYKTYLSEYGYNKLL